MVNESRTDIYEYLYGLFFETVSDNVYLINEPQELTDDDVRDGFLVIRVGDIYDASEFTAEAYSTARCYVEAFIPPMSRGRVNLEKFQALSESIDDVIRTEATKPYAEYHIEEDSVLSADLGDTTNSDNIFYAYVKSFVIIIDKEKIINNNSNG